MTSAQRLDVALVRLNPGLSRRRAQDAIRKGQVSVDGATVTEPGYRTADDAVVVWDPNRKARPRVRISLPVLYADETLLIVDKPAGLLTVPSGPGRTGEDTALSRVEQHACRGRSARRSYVGVVHRIDRGTSGAVAFALSLDLRASLRALFRAHRIERRYAALVAGSPAVDRGVVDAPIRDAYEGGRRGVARSGDPSRPAVTRYTVVERLPGAALLDVELETGRQHQIRAHLAHIGHPVLGDSVYAGGSGRSPAPDVHRPMLHARLLAFAHPLTGAEVRAVSPLPADFERCLARLRRAGRAGLSRSRRGGRRGPARGRP
jgi:23S rRNA pseudouridine1911/1915/1917 synthase